MFFLANQRPVSTLQKSSFQSKKPVIVQLLSSFCPVYVDVYICCWICFIKNVKPLSEIRQVKFHLPPLEEQKRIAEILDQAEELRTKRRKAIAQFDTLPQAIFIEMFGNNAPLESGWDTVSFGNLMEVLTDYHANGSYEILRDNVVLKNQIDHALMIRTTDLENNNATITSNSGYTNRRMVGRCNITHDRGTTETLAGFSQAD